MNSIVLPLLEALDRHDRLTIAVSGGVDSMTLAFVAHRFGRGKITMLHALSPAVPLQAVERLQAFAKQHDWHLTLFDAKELSNPAYQNNPVDRCYFCKQSLYTRIRSLVDGPIASGTNIDDLGDFRPGLKAAAENNVVHPFVEAGINKAGIRALARHYDLPEISELPAQPCLASRIETGIRISREDLAFIDQVESELGALVDRNTRHEITPHDPASQALRCRITHKGVIIETSGGGIMDNEDFQKIGERACLRNGRLFAGIRPYQRGSAFLR